MPYKPIETEAEEGAREEVCIKMEMNQTDESILSIFIL